MKAAAPLMSGFVIYLIGLGGPVLLIKHAISKFRQARYWAAAGAMLTCIIVIIAFSLRDAEPTFANTNLILDTLPDGANNPMGTGQGIFPGRVIWEWNKAATNENCPNTSLSNCFFQQKNNNQDTINKMANNAIKKLSGKETVRAGWDAIFRNFNNKKSGSSDGYQPGETIFIKVNNGQAGWAIKTSDLSVNSSIPISETTPATILAILTQLIDSCQVSQGDIYVGEPMTHLFKHNYDVLHEKYPDVKYLDKENKTSLGRTTITGWQDNVIQYSDNGKVMTDAIADGLCNEMADADYMINIAALKAHARAGITLGAKLHFGSHGNHPVGGWGSFHMHGGLIATVDNDILDRGARKEYGMYRVLTDLMGHEKLGRNTVLFVVDGLWGGVEATDRGYKWQSAPFKNDWPNSLFISQDQVAIESVCIDFLRAEALVNTAFKNRPLFPAVDDHLHQAASKQNWATGIVYDPEGDGTEMPASLGVHEHWNNAADKQYTRNLGTGNGIELISYNSVVTNMNSITHDTGVNLYPNPFTDNLRIETNNNRELKLNIFNFKGQLVFNCKMNQSYSWNGTDQNGLPLQKGVYLIRLTDINSGKTLMSGKVTYLNK